MIEALSKISGHFQILFLVLANGNRFPLVQENIGCHQDGVGKQACIDIVGLRTDLVLEGGAAFQFPNIGVHVQKQV